MIGHHQKFQISIKLLLFTFRTLNNIFCKLILIKTNQHEQANIFTKKEKKIMKNKCFKKIFLQKVVTNDF